RPRRPRHRRRPRMYLIDGYNLLHVLTRGKVTSSTRDHLIGLLEAFCRGGGYRARIVFDPTTGMPSRAHRGEVEVRAVSPGRTAEKEFTSALKATTDRMFYPVVTKDRAISREAEQRQAQVMPCEEFARQLLNRTPSGSFEKSDDVPPGEVDYWLREFGLDDDM